MNVCIILICVLASGSARQCEGDIEAFYLDEPKTRAECREIFKALPHVTPANIRVVGFDWQKPQTQTVEGRK